MQSHIALDSVDHLGADCRAVDVCANVDSGEDRHDVECEWVTRGICNDTVNLHREESKEAIPIKRSGMNLETASHARYIDPMLCPRRVNIGHVVFSTRYPEFRNTKSSNPGERWIPNLD